MTFAKLHDRAARKHIDHQVYRETRRSTEPRWARAKEHKPSVDTCLGKKGDAVHQPLTKAEIRAKFEALDVIAPEDQIAMQIQTRRAYRRVHRESSELFPGQRQRELEQAPASVFAHVEARVWNR